MKPKSFLGKGLPIKNTLRAFTLVEMLVVVAVIMILISLGVYGYRNASEGNKIRVAMADVVTIKKAILNYYQLYGRWPVPEDPNNPGKNIIYTEATAVADGLPPTWGGCYKAKNFEVIKFLRTSYEKEAMLEVGDQRLDGLGNYKDPWGSEYVIQIMATLNNSVVPPTYPWKEAGRVVAGDGGTDAQKYWVLQVKEQVNVYSFGPNRDDDFGYRVQDGDADNDGKIDPLPPPFFTENPGELVDDLRDAKKVDDVRDRQQ